MINTTLPAPKNKFLEVLAVIIDVLIKGLGPEAAIKAAVSAAPALALPVISLIFRWAVTSLANVLDLTLKKNLNVVIIRFQNHAERAAYDKVIEKITKPGATDAEIEAGFKAIDDFITRSK
jgi:hypothetical protein